MASGANVIIPEKDESEDPKQLYFPFIKPIKRKREREINSVEMVSTNSACTKRSREENKPKGMRNLPAMQDHQQGVLAFTPLRIVKDMPEAFWDHRDGELLGIPNNNLSTEFFEYIMLSCDGRVWVSHDQVCFQFKHEYALAKLAFG